jgi:cytochrome P450
VTADTTLPPPAGIPRPIPRKRSWPIVGDTFAYLRDADGFLRGIHRDYGDVCRYSSFTFDWIGLYGPEANQLVFQNRGDAFASSAWNLFVGAFFPRGLMTLDFDEHRLHRAIMQKAFTREALRDYLGTIQQRCAERLAHWQPRAGFRVFPELKAITLDIALEVFTGLPPSPRADRLNRAFLDMVQAATGVVRANVPGTRWAAGLRGRRVLQAFMREELARRRREPGPDLLSRLCAARGEAGELLGDEDIVDQMIFLLMAAHDTTTITLTNIVYRTARHPDWQERLRTASRALGDPAPGLDGLDTLDDMSWVMKESLRLVAPVPGMPRRLTRDVRFQDFTLPAGALVSISPWATHYDPRYWREPERFDPERFSPARREDKGHPFQWVPFGGGAHMCIGLHFGQMEVKAILHQMLLRFRWHVPEGYEMPQDFTSLPIPKDGLPVTLEALGAG